MIRMADGRMPAAMQSSLRADGADKVHRLFNPIMLRIDVNFL